MPVEVIVKQPEPPPLPPSAGSPGEDAPAAVACANCGRTLYGPFCCDCGQHYADIHRSVWRFMVDFLDNVFGWDNKVFLTLRPLITEPGAVTLDYLSGRRVRYVHPLRLFLFTSAICLTIIQFFGGSPVETNVNRDKDNKGHKPGFAFHINGSKPTPAPAPEETPTPAPIPAASPAATPAEAQPSAKSDDDDDAPAKGLIQTIDRAVAAKGKLANNEDLAERIGHAVEKASKTEEGQKQLQKNVAEDVQRRVPWVTLALLPLFALLLRALYWRHDGFYFSHLIFSLHFHTFLLLFGAAYALLHWVLPTSFGMVRELMQACLFLPPVYLFAALRRLYGESFKRTLWKVIGLSAIECVALTIGLFIAGALAFFKAIGVAG